MIARPVRAVGPPALRRARSGAPAAGACSDAHQCLDCPHCPDCVLIRRHSALAISPRYATRLCRWPERLGVRAGSFALHASALRFAPCLISFTSVPTTGSSSNCFGGEARRGRGLGQM